MKNSFDPPHKPMVSGGRLYQRGRENVPIDVGTSPWYNWLEEHTSFLFVDHVGAVTVRKNGTDHGESKWEASCTRMGQVFTISLGPSHTLTLLNLQAAARRLTGKHVQTGSSMRSVNGRTSSRVPISKLIATGRLRSFMRTKLFRPRSSSDIIPRTRLIERLHASLNCEITLVCAPAGFGKTTLLAQWVQAIDCPHAWLSLD